MLLISIILIAAIAWIILSISVWKIHPFFSLIIASMGVGLALGTPAEELLVLVGEGFGGLLASIGLVIILGSTLGVMLESSGASTVIAEKVISGVGKRQPVLALSLLGAFVGIPVFCDAGFIILSRLVKNLSKLSGRNRSTLSVGLGVGLVSTHTLVPPTPGPIAAAGNLGIGDHLGLVILVGLLIVVVTLPIVLIGAKYLTRNIEVELPAEEKIDSEHSERPSFFRSVMPIALPILLISMGTVFSLAGIDSAFVGFLGNPLIALLVSIIASFFLLSIPDIPSFTRIAETGIKQAGPILIITGAGGAFGNVLKSSSLTSYVAESGLLADMSGFYVLLSAFAVAAILKTAQGSSTAAIVISSALLVPFIPDPMLGQPFFIALVIMAIGGGALTFSHANDSYFWVVSQFSGLKVKDAYRSYTVVVAAQGFCVLLVTLGLYLLFV